MSSPVCSQAAQWYQARTAPPSGAAAAALVHSASDGESGTVCVRWRRQVWLPLRPHEGIAAPGETELLSSADTAVVPLSP